MSKDAWLTRINKPASQSTKRHSHRTVRQTDTVMCVITSGKISRRRPVNLILKMGHLDGRGEHLLEAVWTFRAVSFLRNEEEHYAIE